MKLLDKYNRISLITTVLVIMVTGIVYYFTISYILTDQVDKDLVVEEHEIFDYVKLNNHLPQVFKSEDLKITFQLAGNETIQRQFINTEYRDNKDKDVESARGLISSVTVQGVNYCITILESKVETEDLIRLIFLITLGIILLLITILVIINRLVLRNLWQPFYQMLSQIKLFNLTDKNNITGLNTSIEEFKDLNQEVTAMSQRVRRDYEGLKSFVENAAHELMTPIAVINSKLDTLLQEGVLTDKQGALVADVYASAAKMKKLNKTMLLLSRIENGLIADAENINLKEKLTDKLADFQELFQSKNIAVNVDINDAQILINNDLLEILLNNILGNAIQHNTSGGHIGVVLKQSQLSVSNTGKSEALEQDVIFQRFHKSAESEGTGLGLTLSREICESCGFKLAYDYADGKHVFAVRF